MSRHQEGPAAASASFSAARGSETPPRGLEKESSEIRETYGQRLNDQDEDTKRNAGAGADRNYGMGSAKNMAQQMRSAGRFRRRRDANFDQLKDRGYGSLT